MKRLVFVVASLAISFYAMSQSQRSGSVAGHDYVDLGLPSGKLWATCNVGANSPKAWGNYFFYSEGEYVRPYSKRDAVNSWGSTWRIPTKNEWNELIHNCQWKKIYSDNVWEATGPNGNSIYLPAAGYRENTFIPLLGDIVYDGIGFYLSNTPVGDTDAQFYAALIGITIDYFTAGNLKEGNLIGVKERSATLGACSVRLVVSP